MKQPDSEVKTPTRQFLEKLDRHPRLGWYVAVWASVITLNQFFPFLDQLLP